MRGQTIRIVAKGLFTGDALQIAESTYLNAAYMTDHRKNVKDIT